MELNSIIQLISSVGFPIVACIWVAYSYSKTNDKLFGIIENNTKAMQAMQASVQELSDRVEKLESK